MCTYSREEHAVFDIIFVILILTNRICTRSCVMNKSITLSSICILVTHMFMQSAASSLGEHEMWKPFTRQFIEAVQKGEKETIQNNRISFFIVLRLVEIVLV